MKYFIKQHEVIPLLDDQITENKDGTVTVRTSDGRRYKRSRSQIFTKKPSYPLPDNAIVFDTINKRLGYINQGTLYDNMGRRNFPSKGDLVDITNRYRRGCLVAEKLGYRIYYHTVRSVDFTEDGHLRIRVFVGGSESTSNLHFFDSFPIDFIPKIEIGDSVLTEDGPILEVYDKEAEYVYVTDGDDEDTDAEYNINDVTLYNKSLSNARNWIKPTVTLSVGNLYADTLMHGKLITSPVVDRGDVIGTDLNGQAVRFPWWCCEVTTKKPKFEGFLLGLTNKQANFVKSELDTELPIYNNMSIKGHKIKTHELSNVEVLVPSKGKGARKKKRGLSTLSYGDSYGGVSVFLVKEEILNKITELYSTTDVFARKKIDDIFVFTPKRKYLTTKHRKHLK